MSGLFKESGGTFIDIGANVGYTTIPVAKNYNVQCHCFEPDKENFAYLVSNIRENCRGDNVLAYQMAIYDQKGEISLVRSVENSGDHRLMLGENRVPSDTVRVPVDRLDDVISLHSLKRPIGIKIDTQGAESGVFAGAPGVLSAADLLHFEFWPIGMRRLDGTLEPLIGVLQAGFSQGYICEGEANGQEEWIPIHAVIQQMTQLWEDSGVGERYFDVTVRK